MSTQVFESTSNGRRTKFYARSKAEVRRGKQDGLKAQQKELILLVLRLGQKSPFSSELPKATARFRSKITREGTSKSS